jgi:hypothetical protein
MGKQQLTFYGLRSVFKEKGIQYVVEKNNFFNIIISGL